MPMPVVDGDHVAEPDRAIEQDREAGDVVARELLQPEADADAKRAAEYRQQREVDAHRLQREQHADQRAAARARTWTSTTRTLLSSVPARMQPLLDEPGEPEARGDREHDHDDALQELEHRDMLARRSGICMASSSAANSGRTPVKYSSTNPQIAKRDRALRTTAAMPARRRCSRIA